MGAEGDGSQRFWTASLPVEDEGGVPPSPKRQFEKQGHEDPDRGHGRQLQGRPTTRVTATITTGGKESGDHRRSRDQRRRHCRQMSRNLGLEGTKVKVDKTHIVDRSVGLYRRAPMFYAIGGRSRAHHGLAHKAMHEGVVVVEKIAGVKGVHPLNTNNIPGCTYCQPQVASIGLTEAAAKAQGPGSSRSANSPSSAQRQGRSRSARPERAFVKTVVRCQDRRAFWAPHMIGAGGHRTDPGLQHRQGAGKPPRPSWMAAVFPHPTLCSEK